MSGSMTIVMRALNLRKQLVFKKNPLGAVWDAPAGLKEAIQLPAQHRSLQLPGLRGGKTEQTAKLREIEHLASGKAKLATETYMNLTHDARVFRAHFRVPGRPATQALSRQCAY
jgi:hypothetical protein